MRMKKILASVLAGALVITTAVVMPMTVSGAAWTQTQLWEFGNDQVPISALTGVTKAEVTFDVSDLENATNLQLVFNAPKAEETELADYQVINLELKTGEQKYTLDWTTLKEDYTYYQIILIGATTESDDADTSTLGKSTVKKVEFFNASDELVKAYDPDAPVINKDNFTFSTMENKEMNIGDTFTVAFDSTKTPETAKYAIKYAIPTDNGFEYPTPVYNNEINGTEGQEASGLKVTSSTEGKVTTYTFTAVAPTPGKKPFEVKVEISPSGNWDDTIYCWFGDPGPTFMVVDSDVPATEITLAPTELSLYVGEEATLTKTVTPSDTTDEVVWTSSNNDVATVTNGKVKAVGKGPATITATAGDVSATCEVTVKIAATELLLTDINVGVGKTADIVCAAGPEGAEVPEITYESSDPTIFKVVGNKVEGVKTGTATLTATATVKDESITGTCEVKVSNPATAIALTDMTALVGKVKPIVPTLTPANADKPEITYKSSNTSIFTVTEGQIKGVAAGTAKLSAEATVNGTKLTAECDVTVTADAKPATAVTLNKTTLGLEVGDTETLTAALTPTDTTDNITWTSSDTTVATVDENGEVKALKVGEATITAKANGTVSATCTVTVTAKTIAITSVTLNKTTATVEEGETLQLTATVNPETTTEDKTVTWSSSDDTIATVDNGIVTAVKAGEAVITATAGTKSAKCTITVTAKVSEGEGTVDPDEGLKIEVDDEDITIEADADAFEDTVTTVKAEVSVSEEAATEKTDAIADAVKDILDGEESEVKVGAVISITLKDQDGNEIQPVNGGVVTITVPYDGESNYAAYIDGTAPEFIKLAIDEAGEYASFDAKHFSDYYLVALSDEAADAVDKENGENDNNDDDNKNKVEKTYEGSVVINGTDWWAEAEISLEDLIGEFDPDDVQSVAFTCASHVFQVGYNAADDWKQVEISAGDTAVFTDILLKEIPAPTDDDPDAKRDYYLKVCISEDNGVDYTISWVTTALVEDDGSGDNNNGNINISFIDKPYDLEVVDATGWSGGEYTKAAQANTEVNISGITNGTTTFGEIKDKTITLNNIVYRSCGIEGVEASDIEVCIYMLCGELGKEQWVGSQTGSMEDTSITWDLSTLAAAREVIPDSSPIQAIGYQINIKGSDVEAIEAMELGDIVEVNYSGDANSVIVTFEDKTYELAVVDASGWGDGFTRAAQVNTVLDLSGVTYDATTYGDIKNMKLTLKGIIFKNCEIEGIGASDIEVALFMLHGENWSWKASAAVNMNETSVTWDLSTLSAPDSDVIRQIGYQINIKGGDVAAVEAMNIGDTFKINVGGNTPPPETTPEASAPSVPEGSFTVPTTSGSSSGDNTTDTTAAAAPAESEQAAPSSTEEDTSTNTTSPYATKDGGDDVQPTESGTPVPDGGNGDAGNAGVGNAGAGNAEDKNAATGVTLALIPIIAAAAGVVISKKRK